MKFILVLIINTFLIKTTSTLLQQIDCIDPKRKLRCVIKSNCPESLIMNSKRCPSGRICCRKNKVNPYSSLRTLPTFHEVTIEESLNSSLLEIRNRADTDSDKIVFPTDLEDSIYETIPAFPDKKYEYKLYNGHNKLTRESKSEDNRNFQPEEEKLNRITRRSVLECRRYAKVSMEYSHFMPLLPEVIPRKIPMEKCEPQINPLIVGGKSASIEDFPHMAALGYNRNDVIDYLCGGTLISENFVLTAAHCAISRWGSPVIVHLGSTKLYSKDAVKSPVKEVIVHPKYKPPSYYNDIALLRLNYTLTLSLHLRPACLPTQSTEIQTKINAVLAAGWGKTGFSKKSSMTLLQVPLKVMTIKECEKYYEGYIATQVLPNGITSDMLCAGGYEDLHQDTCQGDSGGPLQAPIEEYECMSQVVGITSFGKLCGAGIPGVYIRVLPFVTWIESIVWK